MKLCFPLLLCALATSLLACGGAAEYRKTGSTYAARGPACHYRVIRNRTIEPYEELGVISIDGFSMKQVPNDEEQFRRLVGPIVCAQGGSAVIPTLDIYGRWVFGTVIRFHPSECTGCELKSGIEGEG